MGAVRDRIVALGDLLAEAIVSNDAGRIGDYLVEDWVIVSDTGVGTKEDFLSMVASGELTHSAMERVGEARVRIYGDTAVLTARVINTAHWQGQRFDADEWTTDVWVCRDRDWLCVHSHVTAASGD